MFFRRDTPSKRTGLAIARLLVCLLSTSSLLLPLLPQKETSQDAEINRQLDQISAQGMRELQRTDFLLAAQTMKRGAQLALAAGNLLRAGRFLNASGGASQKALQMREALESYREADALATRLLQTAGKASADSRRATLELAAATALNISTMHLQMDDTDSAEITLREARARMAECSCYRVQLLALTGQLRQTQQRPEEASRFLVEAVEAAGGSADQNSKAAALLALGGLRSELGRHEQGEAALLESYRIRTLHRLGGQARNLQQLALLELRRGNPSQARAYILAAERIVVAGKSLEPRWGVWAVKGDVLRELGDKTGALDAYREAERSAAAWRAGLVPTFASLTESDVRVSTLASHHADLAAELTTKAARPGLAEESLLAVERERAASLLLLFSRDSEGTELGPAYASMVARLRLLEMSTRPADRAQRDALLQRVAEIESREFPGFDAAQTGPDGTNSTALALRRAIPPGAVALSFLVGPQRSWRWTVSRDSVRVDRLPDAQAISRAVSEYRAKPGREAGRRLGGLLLGDLPPAARGAGSWYLSLDGPLFEVPFAGLVESGGAYVVERHALRMVPSLMSLLRPAASWRPGTMLAVADPIYNRADPRIRPEANSALPIDPGLFAAFRHTHASNEVYERPRLAGSAREADRIALLWRANRFDVRKITGSAVDGPNLAAELERQPSVIHIAAHVDSGRLLTSAHGSPLAGRPFIPLSLRPDGTAGALHPDALMRLRLPASLVVLSGCDSGLGRARAGLGLTGLAQAWMLGGASAVVGSLWPVRDDDSPLFLRFYESLVEGKPAPEALREAQIASLRAGGWRSEPAYWAAWTVSAKK